jgi:hypothetical protein
MYFVFYVFVCGFLHFVFPVEKLSIEIEVSADIKCVMTYSGV